MNMHADPTDNPRLWAHRQAHAASLLPGNFADNVLRAARQTREDESARHTRLWRFFHNPFALSALTACVCLITVVVLHTQSTNQINEENLAGWQDIVEQLDSLDPL